ncbi:hypothetical protein [Streptomyces sp. NPDC057238]|uniref:hypothetical protein n=1 Tax=Streptomyces sp. NPDC057238 TaxID=3346060 RepID=UPI0036312B2D
MTDATRRPDDTPPVEGHRTAPGTRGDASAPDARSDAPDPGARGFGTREGAGRTSPGPLGEASVPGARGGAPDTGARGFGAREEVGRTAPGAWGDAPDTGDTGARGSGFGAREETGRTAPDGEGPPPAARPKPDTTAPVGTGTHHDADRTPTGTGTGPHHDSDRTPTGTGTGPHHDSDRISAGTGTGPHHDADRTPAARLLRLDDTDKLTARLQHAVAGFVDAPRDAVQEADRALEELTARFTDAVNERRRTLRRSWQTDGAETSGTATDTEQLRLALRDYRELAERLLHA